MYSTSLKACYDTQAQHFHHTRNPKKRPELDIVAGHIRERKKIHSHISSPTLLDLGCGSGRVSKRLSDNDIHVSYTWVDFSDGMIETARMHYPDTQFHTSDMISYLVAQPQQSTHIIFSLAAFHHLETKHDRLLALHNMYRTLEYGWLCILINRSFSDRFCQKYTKSIVTSLAKSWLTLWWHARNDLLIPRKDPDRQKNGRIHHRYYHLFTLRELSKLISLTDFSLESLSYISQSGELTSDWRSSRNSIVVLRK